MNALPDCWGNVDSISLLLFSFSFQNYIFIIASFAKLAEYEERERKKCIYIQIKTSVCYAVFALYLNFKKIEKKLSSKQTTWHWLSFIWYFLFIPSVFSHYSSQIKRVFTENALKIILVDNFVRYQFESLRWWCMLLMRTKFLFSTWLKIIWARFYF